MSRMNAITPASFCRRSIFNFILVRGQNQRFLVLGFFFFLPGRGFRCVTNEFSMWLFQIHPCVLTQASLADVRLSLWIGLDCVWFCPTFYFIALPLTRGCCIFSGHCNPEWWSFHLGGSHRPCHNSHRLIQLGVSTL